MNISTHIHAGALEGSFWETCDDVNENKLSNGFIELKANCQRKNGDWVSTALLVPPYYTSDIRNCDGDLALGACR